jgi:hypothetical protein
MQQILAWFLPLEAVNNKLINEPYENALTLYQLYFLA